MLSRSSRILVVDGIAESRNATHQMLHTLGHNMIDYTQDGRAALRLIGQNNYRLVLADWEVATLDGVDLLRQTRVDSRLRYLPFVMAISRWQKKFIEIVREDGATLYLTKPFNAEALRERMAQVDTDASRLRSAHVQLAAGAPAAPGRGNRFSNTELWQMLRPGP